MVITATVQPELGQMVYARSEFPHPFQFCFYREGMEHAVQTELAWSGFGQTHLVWKQAGVKELSGSVSGRTQPACYHFPIFTLCSVLSHTCRIIFSKTSPGPILFSLIVSDFGQTGPEASQCARILWPASGQCFPADLDQMRSDLTFRLACCTASV